MLVTIIMVSGIPRSGKTTSAETLHKFMTEELNLNTVLHSMKNRYGGNAHYDNMNITTSLVFQEIVTKKADYIIIDGQYMNYPERADFFDQIDQALDLVADVEVRYIAIQHDRSNYFMFTHNVNPETEKPVYFERSLLEQLNNYQRPIKREGFDLVFNVTGDKYLNVDLFSRCMSRLDDNFPVYEILEDGTMEKVEDTSVKPDINTIYAEPNDTITATGDVTNVFNDTIILCSDVAESINSNE